MWELCHQYVLTSDSFETAGHVPDLLRAITGSQGVIGHTVALQIVELSCNLANGLESVAVTCPSLPAVPPSYPSCIKLSFESAAGHGLCSLMYLRGYQVCVSLSLICKGLEERQNKKHNRFCVGKLRRVPLITTRFSTIPSWPKLEFTISYQIKTTLIHCAHYLLTSLNVPHIYMLEIDWTKKLHFCIKRYAWGLVG